MKKILLFTLLIITALARAQDIPKVPNPPRLVNDFAHVLSQDQIDALERKLVAYDDSTSIQIAVVTVATTGNDAIEDYARKILRVWGVGNKKTNNGIVLLAAMTDHTIRIETGNGMEGAIPDITAKQIIETEIGPNFRNQNYYRGFDEAVDAIIQAAKGEYKAPAGYNDRGRGKNIGGGSLLLGLIVFIIVLIVLSRIGGGGNGGMVSRSGFLPWLLINSVLNSGRGGGGWGGGGGGSDWGGGGGGGFGGFGGGSGGGGGASGSW